MFGPLYSPRGWALGVSIFLGVCLLPSASYAAGLPPIIEGDEWRYLKGFFQPATDWTQAGYDDWFWSQGPSGLGYGDGDDLTNLFDMQGGYVSVFVRRRFEVADPGDVAALTLILDFDDGFVAYINGVEVARDNVEGLPPLRTDPAEGDHEAGTPEIFDLNAFIGQLVAGTNVLAIQGHNSDIDDDDFTLIPRLEVSNPPPDPPGNELPPNGADDAPADPLLCVDVTDPNASDLQVNFHGAELTGVPVDDFTIVALPDTQYYSQAFPETFLAQTQWIVDNKDARNIVFTTHLGDCVENGSNPTNQMEWDNADAAMSLLEDPLTTGLAEGIPWGVAPGNHDQSPFGSARLALDEGATTVLFNDVFGFSRFAGRSYYGGHYDFGDPVEYAGSNDNNYQLFSAGELDFVIVHMEYDPFNGQTRNDVLDWADSVLTAHADRRAIVTSHFLLNPTAEWSSQGLESYDRFKDNPNVFLMLAGHKPEAARRTDAFHNTEIHTVLSDYQNRPSGGDGWLRILTFSPENDEIRFETYSPSLEEFDTGVEHEFTLPYRMDRALPYETIGTPVPLAGGGTACVSWPGRSVGSEYQWYVEIADSRATTRGPLWSFVTPCATAIDCGESTTCTEFACTAGGLCQSSESPDPDADGFCDLQDCDGANPGAWSRPGEATNLRAGAATFEWEAPADAGGSPGTLRYDILRSGNPDDFSAGTTCVETDGADTEFADPAFPFAGSVFYYLVRAENDCPGAAGAGGLGSDSDGAERIGVFCP